MNAELDRILREALLLPRADQAVLADLILSNLEPIDPRIEELILQEVRDRLAALEAGEMETIPAEEVFAELDRLDDED